MSVARIRRLRPTMRRSDKVDYDEQNIISVAVSVSDVNLIGVVKFYDGGRRDRL